MTMKTGTQWTIASSTFSEVKGVWEQSLWPGRKSDIEPTNPLVYLGGYDPDYLQRQVQFFSALSSGGDLLGVISLAESPSPEIHSFYRLRGIFVDPSYRGSGIAKDLVQRCFDVAKASSEAAIWSLPRETALPFYLRMGFEVTSPMIDKEFEFGPNCYVIKRF